jgi:hypothetical protein
LSEVLACSFWLAESASAAAVPAAAAWMLGRWLWRSHTRENSDSGSSLEYPRLGSDSCARDAASSSQAKRMVDYSALPNTVQLLRTTAKMMMMMMTMIQKKKH